MLNRIAHFLLPNLCVFCNQTAQPTLALCEDCQMDLPYIDAECQCKGCGIAQLTPADLCDACLFEAPGFTRALIPFSYESPLSDRISHFKYRADLCSGKVFAQLLCEHVKAAKENGEISFPDWVIPVPMDWRRRWARGFNHTELLARGLCVHLRLNYQPGLIRRRYTKATQKGLTRKERIANLNDLFEIKQPSRWKNKRVALVDDVVTTTATASTLSHLILAAGAAEVQIWALARVPKPRPTANEDSP